MDFSSFIAGSDFSDGDDLYQPKYFLISSPKSFSLQDFVTACVLRVCVCVCMCMCVCVCVCVCVCACVCVCVCVQKNNVPSSCKI